MGPVFTALALLGLVGCSGAAFDVADPDPAADAAPEGGLDAAETLDDAHHPDSRPGDRPDADAGDAAGSLDGGPDGVETHEAAPPDGDGGADDGGEAGAGDGDPAVDGTDAAPGDGGGSDAADTAPACIDGIETVKCDVRPCCAPLICDPEDGTYCVACLTVGHKCGSTAPGPGCCGGLVCRWNASAAFYDCEP
jgi:hypothetical protein